MGVPTYNPYGAAYVMVDVGGGLETLGVSQAGINVRISRKKRAVMSDAAGPDVPADLQQMSMEADIDVDLISWDTVTLAQLLDKAAGGVGVAAAEGVTAVPGILIGTSGRSFPLYLPSTLTGPFYFPCATIRNPDQIKVGTEYSPQRLSFYAWPFVAGNVTSAGDLTLYQRSPP